MSPNQTPSTPDEISRGPRVKNNNRKLLRTNSHCSLNGASGTGKKTGKQTSQQMRNHSGRMFSLLGWMGVRAGRPSCRCVDGRRFRHKAPLSMPRKSAERGVSLVPGSLASLFVFFFHSPAAHPKDLSRSGLANDDGSRAIIGTRTTSVSSPWPTSTERTFTLSSHLRHFLRPALGRKQDPIGHLATLSGVGTARISTPYWLVNKDQLKKS